YFGHLELVNIFLRALKRAGIAVKFSEGFHPKPKVSFDNPLPVGIESLKERFIVTVPDHIRPQAVMDGLNAQLPAGLMITRCQPAPRKTSAKPYPLIRYRVALKEDLFEEARLKAFNDMSEAPITLAGRKGKLKKIDLKDIVESSELVNSRQLNFTLKSEPGKTVRPFDILRHIFNLSEEQVKQATITKLGEASSDLGI
ncbi:MAG: TIGR03936 family radical SAM-associated protein, partial [Desulfobacterales bacterium]|nr:TIGR03936 family radical SAM-associated protein [Desulfobacterales bacterium]